MLGSHQLLIYDYDPTWVQHFRDIKQELMKSFGNARFPIEHIGIT
jgi:GrpB-like predicted nucleotidyltransferase (UPF0157 family)